MSPNLSTTYLGLELASPLVPSASPISRNIDTIRRLEDAGAGAIVLYSLFAEQIECDARYPQPEQSLSPGRRMEAATFYPEPDDFALPPKEYLEHVRRAKEAVGIPIIGSLNGVSVGGWIEYARLIEQAGADALELNVYAVPTDPRVSSSQLDKATLDVVRLVRRSISIPLAVKLSPFYTNLTHLAQKLDAIGVAGLVLFNRFNQPDLDLDSMEVVARPLISHSGDGEALRLPLRWIAILHSRITADLAATGGVHTGQDVVKLLLVGANVVMPASALLVHGADRLSVIGDELAAWMNDRGFASVAQMRGTMSQRQVHDPAAFERAQYVRTVGTMSLWRRANSPVGQASTVRDALHDGE